MKRVNDYELRDHGITSPCYFQGCGTAFTKYTDCVTGVGDNPAEAIDDALESLAMASDYDAEELEARILADEEWNEFPPTPSVALEFPAEDEDNPEDCAELYYYVSILWN
jgi:hypothetical protein